MTRLGILVSLTFAVGCGNSSVPRQAVYGAIAGASGRSGLISFVPKQGTKGPAARVAIHDGRYEFDESTGPFPGTYQVTICLEKLRSQQAIESSRTGVVNVKGVDVPISELDSLPLEYEDKHVQVVSVPESGSLNLDLTLDGKIVDQK
jgi:hypothetical protein